MKKAQIFYFSLQDEQPREEKLKWFAETKFADIPFQHIQPDQKGNWIDLTDNDFYSFQPLIDKDVKAGKSNQAIFEIFTRGVATQRDEWVYSFSEQNLAEKMRYFVNIYQSRLKDSEISKYDIKWDRELEKYLKRGISKSFELESIRVSAYRPFIRKDFYFDKHFNGMIYQMPYLFPSADNNNRLIGFTTGDRVPFSAFATSNIPDLNFYSAEPAQCLPLYRYEKDGTRIDNITDWGLTQFQTHYKAPSITKQNIFHYTYAVLHHPAYRIKYELNLKREFPRLPFYENFAQWVAWGEQLMELHIGYETVARFGLKRKDDPETSIDKPKAKLKADREKGIIVLDDITRLEGIPSIAWDYKLGNRSALEWILDQYKEKKPKDPTIAAKFNTYRFADYKESVIELLDRVCTVSVETMNIVEQMPVVF